jgi:hypothetical protein
MMNERRNEMDKRHGGPYDRGSADSYYRRGRKPHYYVGDTGSSEIITEERMTLEEINEYYQGFDDNEASETFKDWG